MQISLKERLQKATVRPHDFLNLFMVFAEDFFKSMDELCDGEYFQNIYAEKIRKHHREHDIVLCEMIEKAWSLQNGEDSETLFHLIIEPFAKLEINERNLKP